MRALLPLALGLLLGACASGGDTAAEGSNPGPLRMTFRQLRDGTVFELVNESHTARLDQYSEVRDTATRKVATDEVAGELLKFIDERDFEGLAVPGPAPATLSGALYTLEIERDGRTQHVIEYQGVAEDERRRLREMFQAFLEVYNLTWGAQSVELNPGENPFRSSRR